jgi:histone-lysine N-methyltransferase SUV420H
MMEDSSSSDEDEKGVTTPEDDLSPPAATIVNPEDILPQMSPSPGYVTTPIVPRGALTYKPSPIAFAKRRWASVSSDSPSQVQENFSESGTDSEQSQTDGSTDQFAPLPCRAIDELSDEIDDPSLVDQEFALHLPSIKTRDAQAPSPFHKSVSFPLPDSTPSFIRAGWDSSSELSDS